MVGGDFILFDVFENFLEMFGECEATFPYTNIHFILRPFSNELYHTHTHTKNSCSSIYNNSLHLSSHRHDLWVDIFYCLQYESKIILHQHALSSNSYSLTVRYSRLAISSVRCYIHHRYKLLLRNEGFSFFINHPSVYTF